MKSELHCAVPVRTATILGVLLCLTHTGPCFAAWSPPTGIPYPPFGITNTHWMYTNQAYRFDYGSGPESYRVNEFGPYTHYVDNTHPAATDTGNPFGTPSLPRRSWVYPLPAGAVVQVGGSGSYSFVNSPGGKMAFGGHGNEALPIFLYGTTTNRSTMPRIANAEFYSYGNWSIMQHMSSTSGTYVSTRPLLKGSPATNVCVRDCYFTASGGAGGNCFTTGGSRGNSEANYTMNLVLLRNVVHGYGDWQSASENDAVGVVASEFATNVWVLDCAIYNMGGDAVRIGADQGAAPSGGFYYVGRNHFYDNRENAIDVKQARHAVISENVMHGFAASSSSAGEAVVIHYAPQDIWLLNNVIYGSERGINSSGVGTDCYIIGNVVYDCSERGLYLDRGGGTFHVINNTVVSCGAGIVTSGTVTALHYRNNIVADITGYHLQLENGSVAAASSANNFLFHQSSGDIRIRWGGSSFNSVSDWILATGAGQGSMAQDPDWMNPELQNFRLKPGSVAVNAGVSVGEYQDAFKSSFGASILRDLDGDPRPADGAFEIGADEYRTPGKPLPPRDLRVSLP